MLQDEIKLIPLLEKPASELIKLARSLFSTTSVAKEGKRWVFNPNFVTFHVQHARAKSIAVTLRGNPQEFPRRPELELKADRPGYSIFRLESPDQQAAASEYIKRAAELYKQGRSR